MVKAQLKANASVTQKMQIPNKVLYPEPLTQVCIFVLIYFGSDLFTIHPAPWFPGLL